MNSLRYNSVIKSPKLFSALTTQDIKYIILPAENKIWKFSEISVEFLNCSNHKNSLKCFKKNWCLLLNWTRETFHFQSLSGGSWQRLVGGDTAGFRGPVRLQHICQLWETSLRCSDVLNPARHPRQTAADTQPQPHISQLIILLTMKTGQCLSVWWYF